MFDNLSVKQKIRDGESIRIMFLKLATIVSLLGILTNYNKFRLFTTVKQCCLSSSLSTVAVANVKIDHLIESIFVTIEN